MAESEDTGVEEVVVFLLHVANRCVGYGFLFAGRNQTVGKSHCVGGLATVRVVFLVVEFPDERRFDAVPQCGVVCGILGFTQYRSSLCN